jgi:DNA-binding NarL/FixJ family response regulator
MDRMEPAVERHMNGSGARGRLAGAHILVVEDEVLVAMDIQSVLEDEGAEIIGPAYTVSQALELASHEGIKAAVLDLRLNNDSVAPVARLLADRRIPFVFYSGQSTSDPMRAEWPWTRLVHKPASSAELVSAAVELL